MHEGRRCGRPLYNAPHTVDDTPVCLMHSRDLSKDDEALQAEFDRILQDSGEGTADFCGFVFLGSNFSDREFEAHCLFIKAVFTREANFIRAIFTQGVNFGGATFDQAADFSGAIFTQHAQFAFATFTQRIDFFSATFTQGADFSGATFAQGAHFGEATFTLRCDFFEATFSQGADFSSATFTQQVDFRGARFTQGANFFAATFTHANYSGATFSQGADFRWARFTGGVHFGSATFNPEANFRGARFCGEVEFREAVFRHDETDKAGPSFPLARFESPEAVTFYKTYLGQALFHNCDVSKLVFSDVRWRKRPNGKSMVFEEDMDLEQDYAEALRPGEQGSDERNYGLIAELYQQLKKNYDDRRDYWTAGDFHYGEMEMKRLHSPSHNPLVRWLHRYAGLVAWYKYASEYGESYVRPMLLLLAVVALFTLLYPWRGLEFDFDPGKGPKPTSAALMEVCPKIHSSAVLLLTYAHPCGNHDTGGGNWQARIRLVGHSRLTTLYVAAFQREIVYEPNYPAGRLFALVEVVLTSTLIALFLLAVRRQFRR